MSSRATISPLLDLVRLLNGSRPLPADTPVHVIDAGPPRSLLVLAPAVAEAVLRSPHVRQTSIWDFYSQVTGLTCEDLPVLSETLRRLPISLNGARHREGRLQVAPLYRRVEAALSDWVGPLCGEFVADLHLQQQIDIAHWASEFSDRLGRGMVATELGKNWRDLPPLPDGLFTLIPSAASLQRQEQMLSTVKELVCQGLAMAGRHTDEYWPLSSLLMMNRDATQAALLGIFQAIRDGRQPDDARAVLVATTPVSLLQCRLFEHDLEIAGFQWQSGDLVHISPHLLHRQAPPPTGSDFTFGAGPHVCAGMRIAVKVIDTLMQALQQRPLQPQTFATPPPLLRHTVLTALPQPRRDSP